MHQANKAMSALDLTEAKVQKELAEEEGSRLAAGGTALHETSPSMFLVLGMDLEESQYVFPTFG